MFFGSELLCFIIAQNSLPNPPDFWVKIPYAFGMIDGFFNHVMIHHDCESCLVMFEIMTYVLMCHVFQDSFHSMKRNPDSLTKADSFLLYVCF